MGGFHGKQTEWQGDFEAESLICDKSAKPVRLDP